MAQKAELNYRGLSRSQVEKMVLEDKKSDIGLTKGEVQSYGVDSKNIDYVFDALNIDRFYAAREVDGVNMYSAVVKDKYLNIEGGEKGMLHIRHRMADALSSVEPTEELQDRSYFEFMDLFEDLLIPGGRIMHGAGREDLHTTLNNCYVIKLHDDSLDAIYQAIWDEARTYKQGGGCGHDLSVLRPYDVDINGTGGESCGPTGFMELFSTNTNTIAQHGRRGANMQTMRVDHPDVERFVRIKSGDKKTLQYSNISVLITDDFMEAVEKDLRFDLKFPDVSAYSAHEGTKKIYDEEWDGNYDTWETRFRQGQEEGKIPQDLEPFKIHETIRAKTLWDKIIFNAHEGAEPGIIFWDTMRKYHNLEYSSPLVSTNPCGEQPLPDGGCCNLGAINLPKFVENDGSFNWDLFDQTVTRSVRALDNVIDYNLDRHALELQKENAIDDRRVGLGIVGLADMLAARKIRYDSEAGLIATEEVMERMRNTSYQASIDLAKEKGSFGKFDWEQYSQGAFVQTLPDNLKDQIQKYGIRNGTILTVAPTGTVSIVGQTTSGIEPIFDIKFTRRVKNQDVGAEEEFLEYKATHPLAQDESWDLEKLPDYVVTAHEIDPNFRVRMQGIIQQFIDSSISSTVNLPEDVSIETVDQIYRGAHTHGLKGITIYREGSRDGILISDREGGLEGAVQVELVQNDVKLDPRLKKKAQAIQYKVPRPLKNKDSLHIGISSDLYIDEESHRAYFIPDQIFQSRVPLGHATTVSFAQSGIDRTEIFRGPNPDYAEQIGRLQSPFSHEEEGMGPNKIKSIEHAVGLALEDTLLRNGVVGPDENGLMINKVRKENLRKVEMDSEEYRAIMAQVRINGNGKDLQISGNNGHKKGFICVDCGSTDPPRLEAGCNVRSCSQCGAGEDGKDSCD